MPEKPTPEVEKQPQRRFSFTGQLQNRLAEEVTRRMAGLSSQDCKAVIAWLESWQLDLAIQKSVEDNHLEVLKGSGKQEVLLDLIEDAHSWLGKTVEGTGTGDTDARSEE